MKKLFSLFILLVLLTACSRSDGTIIESDGDKTKIIDEKNNTLEIDDKNVVSKDSSGNVLLNSTEGSDSWCPVGSTVKSSIADSAVIGIESINIEGFGVCKACHYVQDSPDYNTKTDWWKSQDGKCERSVMTDSLGTIFLDKWVNSEGKECARQLFDNEKSFEGCS